MVSAADIIARIRSHGANVTIDDGKLVVINRAKLPGEALQFIRSHARQIADYLEREGDIDERAAIMEHDGGVPRAQAEQFSKLLHANVPDDVSPADWAWFVSKAVQAVEGRAA